MILRRVVRWCLIASVLVVLLYVYPYFPGPSGSLKDVFPLEWFLAMAIYADGWFLLLLLLILLIVFLFKKTRLLVKKALFIIAVVVLANLVGIYAADLSREIAGRHAIQKSKPLLHALGQYKEVIGRYPEELHELIPNFLAKTPDPDIISSTDFWYQREGEEYVLSFILPGPPFGHHFIYRPSLREEKDPLTFQLKERIGDWGWYLKV